MPRRPSDAPIEEEDEQVAADTSSSPEGAAIASEHHHTLRVEVPAQAGEWNKKSQIPVSSPRARASASWKRQLARASTPEMIADKGILAADGTTPESMADTRGALKSRVRSP